MTLLLFNLKALEFYLFIHILWCYVRSSSIQTTEKNLNLNKNEIKYGLVTSSTATAPGKRRRPNIDKPVKFGEYKSVVAIYHSQYEYPKCGGVIVSQTSVMTSCTCVTDEESRSYAFPETLKTLLVVAGNPDAENPFHESRTVVRIKIHPYCDPQWIGTRADLAVLEINMSFQTNFYRHVGVVPRYSDLNDLQAMKSELESFMNNRALCQLVTFGYYDYQQWPDIRKYHFINNHTMRALEVIFVQPSDYCNDTCPVKTRCVYDYFARETACVSGSDDEVGPCGVLPGSPVFCKGLFWGMYTGMRNCTAPGAAAVPTVISFLKFFRGIDYEDVSILSFSSKTTASYIALILTFALSGLCV